MYIYEWDEAKRLVNLRKHGIDFGGLPDVFEGLSLTWIDVRRDYGEDRWIGVGLMGGTVVYIVFTEPGENRIRILSARKANRHEAEKFYQKIRN